MDSTNDISTDDAEPNMGAARTTTSATITATTTTNPLDVLTCKFTVLQLIINMAGSFLGPLICFYLLFGVLAQGPYSWSHPNLVGVVVGSLACSPILIFALLPVGLPEAVEKGWFPKLTLKATEQEEDTREVEEQIRTTKTMPLWFRWLLPILSIRWSTPRNVALGIVVGVVYVPSALAVAAVGLGPTLSTWTLIWFNIVYEIVLSVPLVLLGLLGYALEPNLQVTLEMMTMADQGRGGGGGENNNKEKGKVRQIVGRAMTSIRMTLWPY